MNTTISCDNRKETSNIKKTHKQEGGQKDEHKYGQKEINDRL